MVSRSMYFRNGAMLTIELVKVAGMATSIHQTIPLKKALPFPLTKLLTSFPSSSATYRLMSVLTTRKKLWLMSSLNSLLFHPGITIFNKRKRFLKNSRLISTLFLVLMSSSLEVVPGRRSSSACCKAAAFCSEMAW